MNIFNILDENISDEDKISKVTKFALASKNITEMMKINPCLTLDMYISDTEMLFHVLNSENINSPISRLKIFQILLDNIEFDINYRDKANGETILIFACMTITFNPEYSGASGASGASGTFASSDKLRMELIQRILLYKRKPDISLKSLDGTIDAYTCIHYSAYFQDPLNKKMVLELLEKS